MVSIEHGDRRETAKGEAQLKTLLSAAIAAVVATWAFAGGAQAAPGDVTYVHCYAGLSIDGCTDIGPTTLSDPQDVVVSSDGTRVYTAGSGTLTAFSRAGDGSLAFLSCLGATTGCAAPSISLGAADNLAISPNGADLYVSDYGDGQGNANAGKVIHVTPGAGTSMTVQDCLGSDGTGPCVAPSMDAMQRPLDLAMSPDGAHLYLASFNANSMDLSRFTIATLARSGGGSLTLTSCIGEDATFGCTDGPDQLIGVATVAVSDDSTRVFAGGSNGLMHFTQSAGSLAFVDCLNSPEDCDEVNGRPLRKVAEVEVGASTVFALEGETVSEVGFGASGLEYLACIGTDVFAFGETCGAEPSHGAFDSSSYDIAPSPDGGVAYVAFEEGIATVESDNEGGLSSTKCVTDAGFGGCADPPNDVLSFPSALAVSPDGASVYLLARDSGALVHLTTVESGGGDTSPPDTEITKGPKRKSKSKKATFEFTGADDVTAPAALSFECSLDGASFASCSSPATYVKLKKGMHQFEVRASDQATNTDPTPASYGWKVKKKKKKKR